MLSKLKTAFNKLIIAFCWIITALMVFWSFVYFPSLSSWVFIWAAVFSAPVNIILKPLNAVGLKGWKKVFVVFVIFLFACSLIPTQSSNQDETQADTLSYSVSMDETASSSVSTEDTDEAEETFEPDTSTLELNVSDEEEIEEENQEDFESDEEPTSTVETTLTANEEEESAQQDDTSQQTETSIYTEQDTKTSDEESTDAEDEANEEEVEAEITVYITETGAKYHRSGCRYLSKSKIETTLSKATAKGYEPCKVCNPPT